jgi:hypothetical protein
MALMGPTDRETATAHLDIAPSTDRQDRPADSDAPTGSPTLPVDMRQEPEIVPCAIAAPIKQDALTGTALDESSLFRCIWRRYNMDKYLLQNTCNFKRVPSDEKPHVLVHRGGGQDKFNFSTNSKASILYFKIITHVFGDDFPMFPSLLTCQIKGERSCLNSRCPYGIM